eukprot:gnl/TRDRNA2_/TRDRNA2_178034_c2_seq5.p1 gnl/TRDRNA2_/TRDRNA2_178034_c2~~gnl/TRDRNA2_/TRDRNA2_178034_c2_seq5.p1  ORF type:complete len:700 (+),score=127.22 gnl/TRDRNA2_/TRDRNA2_178034_c2_seq5:2-2101(+)
MVTLSAVPVRPSFSTSDNEHGPDGTPCRSKEDSSGSRITTLACNEREPGFTYLSAGVDTAAGLSAMAIFQPLLQSTWIHVCAGANGGMEPHVPGVMGQPPCDFKQLGYTDPVLISSTSSVGTKLAVAAQVGNFNNTGIDLVALCVNDLAARGAEPVFFQNHFSTGKLDMQEASQVVKGVADGCKEATCSFLDASTAELPGLFTAVGCDLVGFAVGVTERGRGLPRLAEMQAGDVVVALPASGLHSNGYSLVRSIARAADLSYREASPFDPTRSLGEALLQPSRIYVKELLALVRANLIHAAVPVTSGGLKGALASVLPTGLGARLQADYWELPTVMRWLAVAGKVKACELATTFNCGLGVLLIIAKKNLDQAMLLLQDEFSEEPKVVGELVARQTGGGVMELEGAESSWLMMPELGVSMPFPGVLPSLQAQRSTTRKRVMVLAGTAEYTPLHALVKECENPSYPAKLVLVAVMHRASRALSHAAMAGIESVVLGDGRFASESPASSEADFLVVSESTEDRKNSDEFLTQDAGEVSSDGKKAALADNYTDALDRAIESAHPELLVILGDVDTSMLTRDFVKRWAGKILMVHASLLPSFPGPRPVEAALKAGVRITGCTVCFAVPRTEDGACGVAHGPQVMQESVRVEVNDTSKSLRERVVTKCERRALPEAVQLVAAGTMTMLDETNGYRLEQRRRKCSW